MTDKYFSQFSAEEQRAAIAIDAELTQNAKRRIELDDIVRAATSCLEARPHFEAFCQSPGLSAVTELLRQEQETFFQQAQTRLTDAQAEIRGSLREKNKALGPRLNADENDDILSALWGFKEDSGGEPPVVYDDVAWGEDLVEGIAQFQAIVERELAETRECLLQNNPLMLGQYMFLVAAAYVEEGCGAGSSVYEVADKLRQIRASLARLRQEAETKPI